jgi:Sec-independent protein secretion pathway component TatC
MSMLLLAIPLILLYLLAALIAMLFDRKRNRNVSDAVTDE